MPCQRFLELLKRENVLDPMGFIQCSSTDTGGSRGNLSNFIHSVEFDFSLNFDVLFLAPQLATPRIPRGRSKLLKMGRDWLEISHDCSKGTPQNQPELTRRFECWGLPWGPLPGGDATWILTATDSYGATSFVFNVGR